MTPRAVQHCRWSTCTLFLPKPFWLDAAACPWSCGMNDQPRPLVDTDECLRCPQWTPEPRKTQGRPDFS